MSIVENEKKKKFTSSDFYLSAFLKAKGFRLLSITRENPQRALFVFQDTRDREGLLEDFLFGRAEIEPKSFVSAIKELKQLLYSDS